MTYTPPEELLHCQRCTLCNVRTNVVPGDGTGSSGILIVGLGPGKTEDLCGVPFIGAAGKLLDKLLATVGISRAEAFITNRVKCLPVENRPTPDQIERCRPWLLHEIESLRPTVGILLGQYAASFAFPGMSMHECNGLWTVKEGVTWTATYHPAAAVRGQTNLIPEMAKVMAMTLALSSVSSPTTPASTA